MLIGYARVSTLDQSPRMQTDALNGAGFGRIFTEQASGGRRRSTGPGRATRRWSGGWIGCRARCGN